MRTVLQAFRRALVDLVRHAATSVLTITTVAVMFLLVGAVATIAANLAALTGQLRHTLVLRAFLKDECTDECRTRLVESFKGSPGVKRVVLVSRKEALEGFRRRLGKDAAILDLVGTNPLPASVELHMAAGWTREQVKNLVSRLEASDGVEDVYRPGRWIDRITGLRNTIETLGIGVGVLVLLVVAVVVANTIRLSVYSRRDEAEIMALVGATDWFIKAPFYFQGLLVGAVGAAAGLELSRVAFGIVGQWFDLSLGYGQHAMQLVHLSGGWSSALIALGAFLGLGGAVASLWRHFERIG